MLFLFSGRIYLTNSLKFAKYYKRYYETIPNFVAFFQEGNDGYRKLLDNLRFCD